MRHLSIRSNEFFIEFSLAMLSRIRIFTAFERAISPDRVGSMLVHIWFPLTKCSSGGRTHPFAKRSTGVRVLKTPFIVSVWCVFHIEIISLASASSTERTWFPKSVKDFRIRWFRRRNCSLSFRVSSRRRPRLLNAYGGSCIPRTKTLPFIVLVQYTFFISNFL